MVATKIRVTIGSVGGRSNRTGIGKVFVVIVGFTTDASIRETKEASGSARSTDKLTGYL